MNVIFRLTELTISFHADQLGFGSHDILRLTDDARDPRNVPTRLNILSAMRWLVRDAHKHDSLFFHCAFVHKGQS